MRAAIKSLVSRSARLFAVVAGATLVLIMSITFFDVIGRTFLGRALVGTVESVELLMGVLVFSGLALTEVHRRHIKVETFQALFPGPVHRLSRMINSLLALGVTLLLTRQLFVKTGEILQEREYTQILHLPYWPAAIVMSAGIVLFLLVLVLRLVEDVLGEEA